MKLKRMILLLVFTVLGNARGAFAPVAWTDAPEVRPGVRCCRLELTQPRLMKVQILRCDLRTPGFRFVATRRSPNWGRDIPDPKTGKTAYVERTQRQTTRDWIAANEDIVVAVNASPWEGGIGNGKPGEMPADPNGFCMSHGELLSENPCWTNVFFVVRRDGRPDIVCSGTAAPSADARKDYLHAFMGYGWFLKDGAVLGIRDALHPRTAYGLSRDRRYLYLMTVDGRQRDWSLGADNLDLAELMLAAGAWDAINMDGGGSSALLYRDPRTGRPVQVNRHDARGAYARPVAINFGIAEQVRPQCQKAAFRLASPFGDHAVLQREKPVLVWGYGARRDEHLTATVGGATAVTQANADGSFRFRFAPQKAGGPFVLEVKDSRGGCVRAEDVYFGEVWLCSGQSNMARHMRDASPQLEGSHPLIRQFLVRRGSANMPLAECGGEWYLAEGSATKNFTAVGAFFADCVSRELGGVAVGLVNASEGGTDIQQWSSAEALRRSKSGLNSLKGVERDEQNPKRFDRFPPYVQDEGIAAKAAHWHEKGFDDSAWRPVELPNDFWTAYKTNQFNGAVWFRRHVRLPKGWVGRKLDLVLGQMDKSDVTWANGKRVGGMGGGTDATFYDTPRIYSTVADSEELVIAFRIWSYAAGGGVYGDAAEMFACPSDDLAQKIPLGGTWLSAIERNIGERHCHDAPLVPMTLFNAMIAPMVPYALRGILWYQGCSNGGNGMAYRDLQNEMVRDWRRRWGDDDLPFACVLLAGIGKRTQYSERFGCGLRLSQALSVRDLGPHAGYVSAVDVGDEGDIHPKDKKTVGERLAQWAMVECYGRTGVSTAPIYLATRRDGVRLRVLFERTGKGLRGLGPDGTVRGVYVAGKDGKYVPAEAKVDGETLVVVASSVTEPVAVRYGWSSFPETFDLTNDTGMPAAPFEGRVE